MRKSRNMSRTKKLDTSILEEMEESSKLESMRKQTKIAIKTKFKTLPNWKSKIAKIQQDIQFFLQQNDTAHCLLFFYNMASSLTNTC